MHVQSPPRNAYHISFRSSSNSRDYNTTLETKETSRRARHSAEEQFGNKLYHLLPLSKDEIRVIKLQPATSLLAPIFADLAVLHLGDGNSQYDALSYRWGDGIDPVGILTAEKDPVTITINERCMSVTQSLETALRYLRHDEEERVIRADSLCINQEDLEEKSIQIQKMDEIYSGASCVRIWLGEAGDSTESAMALLNGCEALQDETTTTQRIIQDEEGVRGLTELLLRPYWSRIWMFQEILLAKRAAVHCGIFVADWWTIKTLDTLTSNPSIWNPPDPRKRSIAELRKSFFNIAHLNVPLSQIGNIENLLFPTSRLQASNDHDKLYALIGLCNIGDYLTVDYRSSTRDTYADFTRCYTQRTGDLSLLYGAGLCQSSKDQAISLPSWVPDFRGKDGRHSLFLAAGFSRAFDASAGKSHPRAKQSGCWGPEPPVRGLLVESLLAGEILLTRPLDVSESGRKELYHTFGLGRANNSTSDKSLIQALAEVLIMDSDAKSCHRFSRQQERHVNVSLFRTLGLIRDAEKLCKGNFMEAGRDYDVVAFVEWAGLAQVDRVNDIYSRLWTSEPKRLDHYRNMFIRELKRRRSTSSRLFSTNSGYIGRASAEVAEGDMVAILSGSRLPFVLRKTQDHSSFQIVSPCYVSGMMFGELAGGSGAGLGHVHGFENIILV
ncbi:ankyrin and HET domain-containing protein [Colletotrichum phormii]|uniref:Ankyrin and HET domain-containing protein n=1 Tax=Colletotrichum phormii TaxID=359342 RepID=A0AAJ0EN02_9PEZI|nr:ankyrin and HET domain-containing protein [Colletotrichum phormii]KAK1655114.1 ankyrin and HET domain-containing protein [Colletotrichum phormii]